MNILKEMIFSALMSGKKISWHKVRNLCQDDVTADKICRDINEKYGIPITYRGAEINYEIDYKMGGGKNK